MAKTLLPETQVRISSPRKKLLLSTEDKENATDMGRPKTLEPEKKSQKGALSKNQEKETAVAPRRSKRRAALADVVANTQSPKEEQTSNISHGKAKSKKVTAKKCAKTDATQTKLNFSSVDLAKKEDEDAVATACMSNTYELETPSVKVPVESKKIFEETNALTCGAVQKDDTYELGAPTVPTSAWIESISEESKEPLTPACLSDTYELETPSVKVHVESKKIFEEANALTCDTPPDSYWREVAEQRRVALERTLEENEQLRDELHVLEVENGQLKSIVQEAKELACIVKDILQSP